MTQAHRLSRRPSVDQLLAYLAQTRWTEVGKLGEVASIWRSSEESGETAEILVPASAAIRDASERIDDAVRTLAQHEGRAIDDVLDSALFVLADVVRVRVVHSDVQDGSIPLEDGVLLNENARDLMLSAATSALTRRKVFLGARPDAAVDYMRTVRLGQTSIGSYVVNLIVPVTKSSNELESRPFSRVVTENLSTALTALKSAATEFQAGGGVGVFDKTIDKGVSSNMCEALIGMSGQRQKRKLSVMVIGTSALASDSQLHSTFEFGSDTLPALEAAVEYFKDNYVLENRTIRGFVKRLDRPHGDEAGTVTITAILFGKNEKNISVELTADDYANAIRAHDQNLLVEISGDIHVTPRTATMLKPSGFRVFDNGELFPE